ncbi:CBS domain-containing protein [Amycolatopsis suaedae]|uniref:CBS domain-containing protein n=2 Tax=Amycolatopsis suaedae TaxID=2510978 RepID=A0A4V2EMS6_9PSEU|nr:CBS domain-containing protein [Amycolatopsis suaedae]
MTTAPYTVEPGTDLKTIAEVLGGRGVSAVPVVARDGTVLGVVSEADLLRPRRRTPWWRRRVRGYRTGPRARDVMTAPAITVDAGEPVSVAARALEKHRIRRLFVTENGKLTGVVARRDLLRPLIRPDAEIGAEVWRSVFTDGLRVPSDAVGVGVEHGVVTLLGLVTYRGDVDLATTLTKAIPGVVEVRNRLDYVWDDHHEVRRS